MKKWTWILIAIVLVGLIGGASVLYNQLSADFAPVQNVTEAAKEQAPDFTITDAEGNQVNLSDFFGKPIVLNFWASWCGPCRQEMPEVKKIYEQYKDKGFDIVGVSLDNNKKAWVGAINKMELPWHHISDLKGWQCEGAAVYGINAIPATILFGPDGKVVAAGLRAHELAAKLAELL